MNEDILKSENHILTGHVNRLMREANKATMLAIKMEAKNDSLVQAVVALTAKLKQAEASERSAHEFPRDGR